MKNYVVTPRILEEDGKRVYTLEVNTPNSQPRALVTFHCVDATHAVELEMALQECTTITWTGSSNDGT